MTYNHREKHLKICDDNIVPSFHTGDKPGIHTKSTMEIKYNQKLLERINLAQINS